MSYRIIISAHLDEAVIEGEGVADGILPTLLVLTVEREEIHDELVDLGQGAHLAGTILDGHCNEADVRVRGLGVCVAAAVSLGIPGSG